MEIACTREPGSTKGLMKNVGVGQSMRGRVHCICEECSTIERATPSMIGSKSLSAKLRLETSNKKFFLYRCVSKW